jgi:hypothetical protein
MDYHDVGEINSRLAQLDQASSYVERILIGYASDYKSNPTNPKSFPIYALRVSANTIDSREDNYQKNGILFECGMHAREWLGSESCLKLAEHLAANRTNDDTAVPELLSYVDVWIIPISNPAGRAIDDPFGGDPTQFYDLPPMEDGWRGNADTRLCDIGVNPARNFSRGFNDASATVFCGKSYRGFAPFSTQEANALRQFVENHSISMAVLLHSNAQQIWNQWDSSDLAGQRMIEEAARIWRNGWSLPADRVTYDLDRTGVGGGNGQFSAWLADESEGSNGESSEIVGPWAIDGDLPVAGDFDRDGQVDDVGVFRPSGPTWYYDYDHDGDTDVTNSPSISVSSYRAFAGDFDRDGFIDDVGLFRYTSGSWYYDYDHDGDIDESHSVCGTSCLIPLAIDADNDGYVDDRVAFCSADRKWYYDYDHDCTGASSQIGPWGLSGDLPIGGDFDRDGSIDDVGVFRPSNLIWYYDLDHNGNTDHASGPWGTDDGLPIAGDFNRDSDGRLDDVGYFTPSSSDWYYDDYHNATIEQLDAGSNRAIQTILIELPFQSGGYYGSIYQQSVGDGSNTFHPSGNAVNDVITDSFIPMAEHLIRQARSPGCPTKEDGTADSTYCRTQDFGIVAAKIVPDGDSFYTSGALESIQAERVSWSEVYPARMQLKMGAYDLVYRAQNFSTGTQSLKVSLTKNLVHCPSPSDCWATSSLVLTTFNNVPAGGIVQSHFDLDLNHPTGEGSGYTIILKIQPAAGGSDDFSPNDEKVFKFRTLFDCFLPLVSKN